MDRTTVPSPVIDVIQPENFNYAAAMPQVQLSVTHCFMFLFLR